MVKKREGDKKFHGNNGGRKRSQRSAHRAKRGRKGTSRSLPRRVGPLGKTGAVNKRRDEERLRNARQNNRKLWITRSGKGRMGGYGDPRVESPNINHSYLKAKRSILEHRVGARCATELRNKPKKGTKMNKISKGAGIRPKLRTEKM